MIWRKGAALLLAAALGGTLLTGCAGSERASAVHLCIKVPMLEIPVVSDPEIHDAYGFMQLAATMFQENYPDADVDFDLEVFEYVDEFEAIPDSYGGQDAADVVFEGFMNMEAYVHTGHVVPLDDVITDALRADIDDALWEMGAFAGRTYMVPFLSYQNILSYNKALFRACGLDEYISDVPGEIQNWSLQDWEIILDTLAQRLPEGRYPMMMYGLNENGDAHLMALCRAFGGELYDAEGRFQFEDEKIVQALTWVQNGVTRGWYPPHAENLEVVDNQEMFNAGVMALCMNNNTYVEAMDFEQGYVNFPGDWATAFVAGFAVFDNGDDETIRVAKDFVKYIYDTPELAELAAGCLPASRAVENKYAARIPMLRSFQKNSVHVFDYTNGSPNFQGSPDCVRKVFYRQFHRLLDRTATPQEVAAELDRLCNAAIERESVFHP